MGDLHQPPFDKLADFLVEGANGSGHGALGRDGVGRITSGNLPDGQHHRFLLGPLPAVDGLEGIVDVHHNVNGVDALLGRCACGRLCR